MLTISMSSTVLYNDLMHATANSSFTVFLGNLIAFGIFFLFSLLLKFAGSWRSRALAGLEPLPKTMPATRFGSRIFERSLRLVDLSETAPAGTLGRCGV